ncbi:hypothetical protein E5163_16275 [Marinicauda algicola]|uniref:DSBA-like thioredoxin domain-containing protein n=1 Tax=Marinicauda algicola TaxID=2029849 RepID=A0A4S2GWM4_9PROT|nr:DsbA family protein [Marinicauda algicola]TGY87268.1 hypothetical protein E5163_16275 [Marinicauda algicola]
MSLSTIATQILTSPRLRTLSRAAHAGVRRLTGRPKTLLAFLEPGEPYSEALGHALPALCERHGLEIRVHPVGAPHASAAPEPEKLRAFAERDAHALCREYGLPTGPGVSIPSGSDTRHGESLRAKLGHYASGSVWFEGEWYTLDRLHHLERRLGALPGQLLYPPPEEPGSASGGEIEMYFSLRSPYSYLALMRIEELARNWRARVHLRPVLPMVMRSLPVPRAKRLYIVRDCKREAERLGLDFGRIRDPLGAGVERGLACFHYARHGDAGLDFLRSFARGVWAEGIDASTDKGLRRIAARAGLHPHDVDRALEDESWRHAVERNRIALFEAGLWGVPSFVVGGNATFGQDRLWQVGHWLQQGEGGSQRSQPGDR